MYTPLADRLRPQSLEDVCGQKHILGKGKLLYNIAESGRLPNVIFYGPSGTGKTTTANILAKAAGKRLHRLNATTASLADIKAITDEINTMIAPNGVLLYLDEIQYFNKKQQQSLLEFVENGEITLIASTTENPYFYIYGALLSRCTVFEFKPVPKDEVKKAINRGISVLQADLKTEIEMEEEAKDLICAACGGDVRKALNALEVLCIPKAGQEKLHVGVENAREAMTMSAVKYDRDADNHYDLLSGFQKSIRGSDENAALHYLARLLCAGDLISVCRRLLVIAAEDIGLAYPQALSITKAAVDSALQLGLPEARIPLAEAVILLATAPKSNSAITAVDAAIKDVEAGMGGDIPDDIRDAHYEGAKDLGHGVGYKYPPDYPGSWVKQAYAPKEIQGRQYYTYGDNKFEQATKAYWDKIKK